MKTKIIFFVTMVMMLISVASAADTTAPTVDVSVSIDNNQATISGTAADTSNDVNVTAGIQRVELSLDGNPWVTASGTAEWTYTFEGLANGHHAVSVRSIDSSNNPSETVIQSFSVDYEDIGNNDLSWYITISDLHFRTESQTFNVRTVETGNDVCVVFDIVNEADTDRKLRYTVTKGTIDVQGDTVVASGKSEEVKEWFNSQDMIIGVNLFDIEVEDWETHETVAEKTVSITVEDIPAPEVVEETVVSVDDEIPAWFVTVAKLNNISLTADETDVYVVELEKKIADQKATIDKQTGDISNLQARVTDLESGDTSQPVQSSMLPGVDDRVIYLVILLIIGYFGNKKYNWIDNGKEEEQSTSVDPE